MIYYPYKHQLVFGVDKRYINLTTERKDRKMNEEDLEDTPEIKWVVTHYLNDVTIKWFKYKRTYSCVNVLQLMRSF